jgi:hypothetical protein
MLFISPLATKTSLPNEFFLFRDLLVKMCRNPDFLLFIFPVAVKRNLLAAPRFVFILGILSPYVSMTGISFLAF